MIADAEVGGVRFVSHMVPVSREFIEQDGYLWAGLWEACRKEAAQVVLDGLDGPRLGPGRSELDAVTWLPRRRARIRANVPGRPAGLFRRAA